MFVQGCTTHRVRHGRFSIVSRPCEQCGRRSELRGCLSGSAGPLAEILRGDPVLHHPCACGADLTFLVPPFVDRSCVTVSPTDRPGRSSDLFRPAA